MSVRVYGPLNDFLPPARRQRSFVLQSPAPRSVKDLIESLGVPHPEIDLVVLNGEPAPFDRLVREGDRIAVFPKFFGIDISEVTRVRPRPPVPIRFLLDGHLGKLARWLRLVGLDAACPAAAGDDTLASLAPAEARILLTRDRELLKRRAVVHGYFVRETRPHRQLVEVLRRFEPPVRPFSRCLRCNGELDPVEKAVVEPQLPPRTREHYRDFLRCRGCGRVYWRGAHWARLVGGVRAALDGLHDRERSRTE
ncbi:MAG TPA: Mut7-C RNAse domain-containing protein [Vicinamibacterales bacterium]|nr:Mut7-C RNAse domain-containing protein [Vicinamibacterales bacterium]